MVLQKMKTDRRGLPRRGNQAGGHHGAGPTSTTHNGRRPRDSGAIAGLEVLRIVNEPTAAALAYGTRQGGAQRKDRRVRPRRRHLRHLHSRARGRGLRGQVDQRRHPPGRGTTLDQRVIDWIAEEFEQAEGKSTCARMAMALSTSEKRRQKKAKMRAVVGGLDRNQTSPSSPRIRPGPKHVQTTLSRAKCRAAGGRSPCRGPRVPCEQALPRRRNHPLGG